MPIRVLIYQCIYLEDRMSATWLPISMHVCLSTCPSINQCVNPSYDDDRKLSNNILLSVSFHSHHIIFVLSYHRFHCHTLYQIILSSSRPELAAEFVRKADEDGLVVGTRSFNCMISSYARTRHLALALEVLNKLDRERHKIQGQSMKVAQLSTDFFRGIRKPLSSSAPHSPNTSSSGHKNNTRKHSRTNRDHDDAYCPPPIPHTGHLSFGSNLTTFNELVECLRALSTRPLPTPPADKKVLYTSWLDDAWLWSSCQVCMLGVFVHVRLTYLSVCLSTLQLKRLLMCDSKYKCTLQPLTLPSYSSSAKGQHQSEWQLVYPRITNWKYFARSSKPGDTHTVQYSTAQCMIFSTSPPYTFIVESDALEMVQ